jgi:hypothetical protein
MHAPQQSSLLFCSIMLLYEKQFYNLDDPKMLYFFYLSLIAMQFQKLSHYSVAPQTLATKKYNLQDSHFLEWAFFIHVEGAAHPAMSLLMVS